MVNTAKRIREKVEETRIVESERTMNVSISAKLYRKRNHASNAIPSPEATLLVATALRANESTLNIESGDIEKTAIFTLHKIISANFITNN